RLLAITPGAPWLERGTMIATFTGDELGVAAAGTVDESRAAGPGPPPSAQPASSPARANAAPRAIAVRQRNRATASIIGPPADHQLMVQPRRHEGNCQVGGDLGRLLTGYRADAFFG